MNAISRVLLVSWYFLTLFAWSSKGQRAPESPNWAGDRVMMQLRHSGADNALRVRNLSEREWLERLGLPPRAGLRRLSARRANGSGPIDGLELDRPFVVELHGEMGVEEALTLLKKHPDVIFAEPDYVARPGTAPDDPFYPSQWHHQRLESEAAWAITTGSENVIVAVLDSGVNYHLSEFAGRTIPGHDYANEDSDPDDDQGHGTSAAGVIAATGNNATAVAGMDWHCRIMPQKVIGSSFGHYSWLTQATYDATDAGAKVISLSMGGDNDSAILQAAIDYAIGHGVIFITIAGNDAANRLWFPGRLPQCITAGASERDDSRAPFSNYGSAVDLLAPGTDVYTVGINGEITPFGGTSASAPQVSGVAALVASLKPSINQRQMEQLLCATAADQVGGPADTPGWDQYHGFGRLNARYAVELAATSSVPHALNISTRLRVGTGDNAMIGGFIITGAHAKNVIIRALGPALGSAGITDFVHDPRLELYDAAGTLLSSNDDWITSQQADIAASGLAPADPHESAVMAILQPGAYTAVVRGADDSAGVALLEIYDLQPTPNSKLANLSTRGLVAVAENVMIGGFIVSAPSTYVVRALGPSLHSAGIENALSDPKVELHNAHGDIILQNDDWESGAGAALVQQAGLAPADPRESALYATLAPGSYTAVVQGKTGTGGVGLVEFYNIP